MTARRRLDVVCPVFREEEAIGLFHAELAAALDRLAGRYDCRVIYVLDPSPDGTEQRLAEISAADPRVLTIVLSRRFGHQAALIAGLESSDADAVVMMDADLQHPPEVVLDLVEKWEAGADIVQAVRMDAPATGKLKRLGSHLFYKLVSTVGSVDIESGSADFRLFSRRVVQVFTEGLPERNPFIRGLSSWVGYTVAYVGFTCPGRVAGESKYSLPTLLELAISGVTSFSKVPIRAAAVVGLLMTLLSCAYAAVAVGGYLLAGHTPPAWAGVTAVVTFVAGIQLLFLGLVAEYVGQIFDEVKGRPRYLVAKTYGAGALRGGDARLDAPAAAAREAQAEGPVRR